MNGYLESDPKFSIGDLVVIDKKLYKSLTSKNFPAVNFFCYSLIITITDGRSYWYEATAP